MTLFSVLRAFGKNYLLGWNFCFLVTVKNYGLSKILSKVNPAISFALCESKITSKTPSCRMKKTHTHNPMLSKWQGKTFLTNTKYFKPGLGNSAQLGFTLSTATFACEKKAGYFFLISFKKWISWWYLRWDLYWSYAPFMPLMISHCAVCAT